MGVNQDFDNDLEIKDDDDINKIGVKKNMIIGTIKIEKNKLRQRLINSYENMKFEEWKWMWENIKAKPNRKEIEKCEIFINDKRINKNFFNYEYTFPKEGNYTIKYIFKKPIKSTCFMFCNSESLTSLDFSKFNTKEVTDMGYMFFNCNSLVSLNLSNCKTNNVTNMDSTFFNCSSLVSLDLSSFNTTNVKSMHSMFSRCYSLISLNLSSFNTKNLTHIGYIFYNCHSLLILDISNFNLKNIQDGTSLFECCYSLISVNLPTRYGKYNIYANIFKNCSSLIKHSQNF